MGKFLIICLLTALGCWQAWAADDLALLGVAIGKPPVSGHPMVTGIYAMAGSTAALTTSAATFCGLNGGINCSWLTTNNRGQPIAVGGAITNLHVRLGTSMSGGTNQWDIGLVDISSAGTVTTYTTLHCVLNAAGTGLGQTTLQDCTSGSNISVAAGDLLLWVVCPGTITTGSSGLCGSINAPTPGQTVVQISAQFTSTNNNESFLAGSGNNPSNTGGTNYIGFTSASVNATETVVSNLIPTNGQIDQLYVSISAAPGTGTKGWVATVWHNETNTSLQCTISNTTTVTTCSDLAGVDGFSVSAGERISVQVCPALLAGVVGTACTPGTAPAAASMQVGVRWRPTIPDEALVFSNATLFSTGTSNYNLSGNGQVATETNSYNVAVSSSPQAKLKKFQALISTDPGGSAQRNLTLRQSSSNASTNIACNLVAGCGSPCSCTGSGVYTTASTDLLNFQQTVPGTTPAADTFQKYGFVSCIGSGC